MRASELRIGNFASVYGSIPLTPEWLERFGFEDVDEYYYHEGMRIYDDGDGKLYYMSNDALVHLDYVHQLQNLYFALTGEELIIKNHKKEE